MDQPRAELALLCRQICVQVETATPRRTVSEEDFLRALVQVQEQFGAHSVGEDALWEIVAQEEKRVADAAVIAEILLPKLSSVVRAHPAPATPSVSHADSTLSSASPAPTVAAPTKAEAPAMARNAPLGVADLIQGMLDQDRGDSRPRSTSR